MEEVEEVEGTVSLQGSGRTGPLIALPGKDVGFHIVLRE